MFSSAKMCKVRVIGLKSSMARTIDTLEQFGAAEIKRFSAREISNSGSLVGHEESVEKLLRVEALLNSLPEQGAKQKMSSKEAKEYLKSSEFKKCESEVTEINGKIEQLQSELESLKETKNRLKLFSNFDIDFGKLRAQTIMLAAGLVQNSRKNQLIYALGKEEGLKFIEKSATKNSSIIIIAIEKAKAEKLDELSRLGFERIAMPEMSSKPAAEIKRTEQRVEEIDKKKLALAKELAKISQNSHSKIAAAKEYLEIESGKSGAATLFGNTNHSFIMEAYIPEKNYREFERIMRDEFAEKTEIRKFSSEELAAHHEETPTLLEHSRALAPFEFMTKFVSMPRSNEIDPTVLFIIFFPIFYGMMVGDFIYGIISFLIARVLFSKSAPDGIMRPISQIWMWSAIPTIIFGIIFDEYAGMSHVELFEKVFELENFRIYHGLERLHETQTLLTITILLGIAVLCLGFILGFINAMKHGNKKHALAKLGWLGITLSGTALVAIGIFNALPQVILLPSGIIALVSLAALLKTEGPIALIEIPSIVGNILSFARILAVGLVGVIIALILNDLAFPTLDKGILLIVLIPLYIGGHVFNAFLAMFESFVQGARLNYVEFYSKFYEGGGKEFAPFRFVRKYTKE